MKVVNAVHPSEEQSKEFFSSEEDGPLVMVNMLKFKATAEYEDGSDADLSGAQAYARYGAAIQDCLKAVGATPVFSGAVTDLMLGEVEENWDMVALVQYPSLAAFQKMVTSPEYQAITHHRTAGLAGQLNIKTKPLG